MYCPSCHAKYVAEDTYCRNCGTDLAPASTDVVPAQANLPALLYKSPVPRSVAAGVGAIAVGFGLELLRRGLLAHLQSNRAVENSLPALAGVKDILFPQNGKQAKLPKGYEMQETIMVVRRVVRRVN
ncbi:MAG: hypothetical protein NVS2B12_24310 [Ktedonobacteraceae bacterium]